MQLGQTRTARLCFIFIVFEKLARACFIRMTGSPYQVMPADILVVRAGFNMHNPFLLYGVCSFSFFFAGIRETGHWTGDRTITFNTINSLLPILFSKTYRWYQEQMFGQVIIDIITHISKAKQNQVVL